MIGPVTAFTAQQLQPYGGMKMCMSNKKIGPPNSMTATASNFNRLLKLFPGWKTL